MASDFSWHRKKCTNPFVFHSSATAIGRIYVYISIQIRYTMVRCQLSVVSVIGSLVFEAKIEMFDSCRKWLSRKRCDICVFVNMPVYGYQPNKPQNHTTVTDSNISYFFTSSRLTKVYPPPPPYLRPLGHRGLIIYPIDPLANPSLFCVSQHMCSITTACTMYIFTFRKC